MVTEREKRESYLQSIGLRKETCRECGEVITGREEHKCPITDILQESNLDEDFLFQ